LPETVATDQTKTRQKQILHARGLVKIYRRRRVVDDVDIEVPQGKIVGLLGPNGAGKTTSFYIIMGLIRPNAGKVYLDDKEITKLPIYRRSRLGIGYLAQEPSVFRKLSVQDNILLILEALGVPHKTRMERTDQLLEELELEPLRRAQASTLSGGERRRVEIARALAGNPNFLLLDEPFTGVDPIAIQDIQMIIMDLKKKGFGILITDHSVREILAVCDQVYIMHKGKILQSGTAKEIAQSEIAKKYYLGERFQADASLFNLLEDNPAQPDQSGEQTAK
jgi:lipopolysaccharide export system ATP-binding protein